MSKFVVSLFDKSNIPLYKENHADVVVAGIKHGSYRSVKDFDYEELKSIKQECLNYNLEMFVLLNRFYHDEQLPLMKEQLSFLKEIDVDGIYFGDEAVLYYARELGIVDKLIYLPDTLLCNALDCRYYLDEGMKLVSLSKEITQEEVVEIGQVVGKQLEIIIHGRVVMMHSKRKLLSAYQEFVGLKHQLSGCKDLYITEENRDAKMPIYEDEFGTHVFSGYTLESFDQIKAFKDAGIEYFKIDGIFHDVDWVIETLKAYHDVLNGCEIKSNYYLKHENDALSNGFYNQKTSKVKE